MEFFLTVEKLREAQTHADTGGGEAPVPADFFAERAGHQRCQEGAKVYAHVVDGEAAVASRVVLAVKRAEQRRHVGFEEAVADNQQAEGDMQQRGERHGEMPHGHGDATDQHTLALAQVAIGEIAAQYGSEIDETGIGGVNL